MMTGRQWDQEAENDESEAAAASEKRDEWFLLHFSATEAELIERERRFEALKRAMRPEGWR